MKILLAMLAVGLIVAAAGAPVLAADMVPFKATISAAESVAVLDPARCPAENPVLIPISGTGNVSHLGKVVAVQSQCVPPPEAGRMDIVNGQFTFTAANGDAISGTYSGVHRPTATPGILEIDGEAYITEGTGRFKGVTGAGILSGSFDLATVKLTLVFHGAMTSVGTAKK